MKLAKYANAETMDLARVDPTVPVHMLNLLKFKEKATYDEDESDNSKQKNLTGREAYEIYTQKVKEVIENLGGKILYVGDVKGMFLGELSVKFDMVLIVMYPNIKTFIM